MFIPIEFNINRVFVVKLIYKLLKICMFTHCRRKGWLCWCGSLHQERTNQSNLWSGEKRIWHWGPCHYRRVWKLLFGCCMWVCICYFYVLFLTSTRKDGSALEILDDRTVYVKVRVFVLATVMISHWSLCWGSQTWVWSWLFFFRHCIQYKYREYLCFFCYVKPKIRFWRLDWWISMFGQCPLLVMGFEFCHKSHPSCKSGDLVLYPTF